MTAKLAFAAILVVGGAFFAPKALDKVGAFLGDLVGSDDAVVIGEGETAFFQLC